jgi:outer membrane lipoprotein-sorting protein
MRYWQSFPVGKQPLLPALVDIRLLLRAALPVILLCLVLSPEAGAASLEEIVGKVQERYEKLIDIKADFLQEATIKSMNKTDREEGVFYFKNPRRMVWDYLKPKAKKLVINPQKAWLYVPEDGVVYIQKTAD